MRKRKERADLPENEFERMRELMVEQQLVPRGIRNPGVLDAFRKVPRHRFVEKDLQNSAYDDHPLPIGEGQTISQPFMVACMTQCLDIKKNERVLEIGTGSGYQAAILAEIAAEVYTVERIDSIAKKAEALLRELGYNNVQYRVADGTNGWPEKAPFNGIIVTAGAPRVPEPLVEQLAEGGRLLIPVGGSWSQELRIVRKEKEGMREEYVCGCVFVPLVGEHGWREG
ncbi:MAG: protein-L-isoaspartate(D-aspartate) O-methyltransferase [Candidatus Aureabacteria bacterium]|nr:protein-L-isoaspartate(D-aspartate) O-methyltransferase [Candidatus Auribacterota bacterium]